MKKKLLVGFDCSECSQRALDYAAEWARVSHHELIVAHVIQWSPYSFNTPQELEERHKRREAELARAHREIIDPVVDKLRAEGIECSGAIRHGHPAETLNELARELAADNMIIGRTGSSRIRAQLFGSVMMTLVQISVLPVTVVP